MKQNNSEKYFLWGVVMLGVITMIPATIYDYAWTEYLWKHPSDRFQEFMADTIFELNGFGGGDPAFIFLIMVGVLYLLAWVPAIQSEPHRGRWKGLIRLLDKSPHFKNKLIQWRPYLGYMVVCGLSTAVYLVHPLKWIMGRWRPKYIFKDLHPEEYTEWYEFGSQFISQGHYHGSFPSGHVATVFMFMSLAYVLVNAAKAQKYRVLGWLVGLLAVALGVMMLLGRAMAGMHWVSDSVFVLFGSWVITHLLYFQGLQIPYQEVYPAENGKAINFPFFYELRICWYLFVMSLGITLFFFGVRAILRLELLWLIVFIPLGAYLCYFGIRQGRKLGFFRKGLRMG